MKGLGIITDLQILGSNTKIIDQKGFAIVRTESNPTFYDGNFLHLKSSPSAFQKKELEIAFDKNFSDFKKIKHFAFKWTDENDFKLEEYQKDLYEFDKSIELVLPSINICKPKRLNKKIEIREFNSNLDWGNLTEILVLDRNPSIQEINFRNYLKPIISQYRNLHKNGKGNFFGAYKGKELVGVAGLFTFSKIGRFQEVITKAEHRNQGICSSLVYEICKLNAQKVNQFVIIAEFESQAEHIYRKIGFSKNCFQFGLTKVLK